MYPNLKLQIWRLGLRQNSLARSVGIDESLLSKIINGFRAPDAVTRARIASALHSDEAWLFTPASAWKDTASEDSIGAWPQRGDNPEKRRLT
jgi:transcriptional regulator with XRE-family HTH domain